MKALYRIMLVIYVGLLAVSAEGGDVWFLAATGWFVAICLRLCLMIEEARP